MNGEQSEFQKDREAIESATNGRWKYFKTRIPDDDGGCAVRAEDFLEDGRRRIRYVVRTLENATDKTMHVDNAAFVVRAHERWPVALDEIERLQGLLRGVLATQEALYQAYKMTVEGISSEEVRDFLRQVCLNEGIMDETGGRLTTNSLFSGKKVVGETSAE